MLISNDTWATLTPTSAGSMRRRICRVAGSLHDARMPARASRTEIVVPGFQYWGPRYQTWLPLGHDHTPGCGGLVVTNSRFCTAARASAGTGGSNSITMGMPTPTVSPLFR